MFWRLRKGCARRRKFSHSTRDNRQGLKTQCCFCNFLGNYPSAAHAIRTKIKGKRRESHARRVLPARDDAEYTLVSSTRVFLCDRASLRGIKRRRGSKRPCPSRITGRCHRGKEKYHDATPEIADRDWFRLKPRSHLARIVYSRVFFVSQRRKTRRNFLYPHRFVENPTISCSIETLSWFLLGKRFR